MGALSQRIAARRMQLGGAERQLAALLGRYGQDAGIESAESPRFKTGAQSLCELRVAAVMDGFTLGCFGPECRLMELTSGGWREEIDSFRPDMLFIESAWEGKDGSWRRLIANGSAEYYDMTSHCRERGIPVVFWNKEDPVYTDVFMPAARMADFVFTTDIGCVERYRAELMHERVYWLHFAAQPALHNPFERYERKDSFCFAGAYYHRYEERSRVFDEFAGVFIRRAGLCIYDRNHGCARPEHAFPAQYAPHILGRLDFAEIDRAYKGYLYGVNMNSVQQSETMFARRVFELLASNTITVGNYSRGVRNLFGDLTISTDDARQLESCLARYCADEDTRDKYRLLGLRKVLCDHLYAHRLSYVAKLVFGAKLLPPPPLMTVVSAVRDAAGSERVLAMYRAQTYRNRRLALFAPEGVVAAAADITLYPIEAADTLTLGSIAQEGYIAHFSPADWYGAEYLADMALITRCGSFTAMGKAERFASGADGLVRLNRGAAYRPADELPQAASAVSAKAVGGLPASRLLYGEPWRLPGMVATDRFNYAMGWAQDTCPAASDLQIADQGMDIREIQRRAESISADVRYAPALRLGGADILTAPLPSSALEWQAAEGGARLVSRLRDGEHSYLYLPDSMDCAPLMESGRLPVCFEGRGGLDLICVVEFRDAAGGRLAPQFPRLNRREQLTPPPGAVSLRLGFRPKGPGECLITGITVGGGFAPRSGCLLPRSGVLVLTNLYPSPDELYRNMFVHQRVRAYREAQKSAGVMRMSLTGGVCYREFEGVDITEGRADTLDAMLGSGRIGTVCVHFLDPMMWSVLKGYARDIRVIVWLHGSEIQPWWRRSFNYTRPGELERAKASSLERERFWAELFREAGDYRLEFVFVSEYFRDEVSMDYGIELPPERCHIIHNCIDTERFAYVKKDAAQRTRLLSIRPYASAKYANDLTVKCIELLAARPFFRELSFTVIGSGELFESTLRPLRRFKNVDIQKRFLRQDEIAALHRQHGIFLVPTRMDSQGVSRDEAMSSGLVPVTNSVAAISEFTDESCAILAPPEDARAMADGIERLYRDPALFEAMSEAAARRVRAGLSAAHTIERELELIFGEARY